MDSNEPEQLAKLRAENARLIELLEAHGVDWRLPRDASGTSSRETESFALSTADKVSLFRQLFTGRADVYALRWESRTTRKAGYAPACANEWRPGVCEKPRTKCSDCSNRDFLAISDEVIYSHLAGEKTIGIYPLLTDDTCHLLAVDFDDADWRQDVRAFARSCRDLDVPVAIEISRSGNGAHAWFFFSGRISSRDTRRLGTAIISHTCAENRQLALTSYDRLFPNQDIMPKGGFGNLIALPLQKKPRDAGHSVFVDEELQPYADQWAFLASIERMSPNDVESIILRATGGAHPLDVTFVDEEDLKTPWKRAEFDPDKKLSGPLPDSLTITMADRLYFEKAALPQALANRLIRLAAFQNPEFHKAQAMRLSVWNKPRIIGCAENFPRHIALPRGCLEAAQGLLRDNGIGCELQDERFRGDAIAIDFAGDLRDDQESAVAMMLNYDIGVLCAPTGFGKTVVAAAIAADRGVNTLVLVHRTELLRQWKERLQAFLDVDGNFIGTIGGGKAKPSGKIDIAVMQSLSRKGKVDRVVENYGHVIVDECHHIGAVSFDAILKTVKAKYVLGLTATPIRRDGQQPIIFMQCGPIRYTAAKPRDAPHDLEVIPHLLHKPIRVSKKAGIQDVFRTLCDDEQRTTAIADEIERAFEEGRKVLALTERTKHLDGIATAMGDRVSPLIVLHGRLSKKQRASLFEELDTQPENAPRVVLATGKLIGEGFDHPALDTLILCMPISWKGTLQQYAGRLHRDHVTKSNVRIIDFVDTGHPALLRMWDKRQRGYRAMGYRILDLSGSDLFRREREGTLDRADGKIIF